MNYNGYKRVWNGVIARHEQAVLGALRSQMEAFAKQLEADSNAYPWELPTAELERVLIELYRDAGVRWGRITTMDIGAQVEGKKDALGDLLEAYIQEYLRLYLLNRSIVPITDTSRAEILAIMQQGAEEGWGAEKIARAIRDSGITIIRARLIARTEATRAMNSGGMLSAAAAPIATRKTWVSAQTNRTRRVPRDQFDHFRMDKKVAEFDQPFEVPSKMGGVEMLQFPGDPAGSAGNVCNCRCMCTYRGVRDANGDLMTPEQHNPKIVNNEFYKVVQGVRMQQRVS